MNKKIKEYNQAQLLRRRGKSIRSIAKALDISTSSASVWCRDIRLTQSQKTKLSQKGQTFKLLKSFAKKRHLDKIKNDKLIFNQAKKGIRKINKDGLFIAGLALYWAEGFKSTKETQVGFCNSDPKMIKFIIKWFKEVLSIPSEDFVLRAEFNITHQTRNNEIENYWSDITSIPKSQFTKPYLQKAKLLRDYSNRGKYYGLLRIRIRRSSQLLTKLKGWIEGLRLIV